MYLFLYLISFFSLPQNVPKIQKAGWSALEVDKANTGKDLPYLSLVEKETIIYLNLARLYPKKFAKLEVENYQGSYEYGAYFRTSDFQETLLVTLNAMKPINQPLKHDLKITEYAKCFARESGQAGTTGHSRLKCQGYLYAECCSYGMRTGKDIVLQLLIDHKVPSLGHRNICLDPGYTKVGVGFERHKSEGACLVLNLE